MFDEVEQFIRRIAFGYPELSQDKVFAEYQFFRRRARELYDDYFHEDFPIGEFNDGF